jgi:predicted RNase H-like nuclease
VIRGHGSDAELVALHTRVDSAADFADYASDFGQDVAVAIDAPLVVTEERRAEANLGRVFGRFKAGAYSAKPKFLANMGGEAGPRLREALAVQNFSLDPSAIALEGRRAFEVYPHAAHVVFFELQERLAYKKGKVLARRESMRDYQRHLRGLLVRLAPGVLGSAALGGVLEPQAADVGGAKLKRLEDTLDAITCACIAIHCAVGGRGGYEVFGCFAHGYIVVPGPLPTGGTARACPTCAPAPPSP